MISLYLAAFITIFVCNLVHTDKFHGNLKPPDNFLKILHSLETNHQLISPPSFKDIENKEGNYMGLQMFQPPTPPPPDFVFTSERPHYSLALFSSFIGTCTTIRLGSRA